MLLIIGGNWEQVPLIQTARRSGVPLLVTDPSAGADGFALADRREVADPRNLPLMLEIARRYGITGVTADACDYSHYAAAFLSACLGLPGDGIEPAQLTTNKRWQREACRAARVVQPRFFPCRSLSEAQAASQVIGWPVIVKPVDNRGAYGVNVVRSTEGLRDAYLDALMNAHSREVLVEAYIEGMHITIDGCVDQSGRHINLAIASKSVLSGKKPIIMSVDYPAKISDNLRERLYCINNQVIGALGIRSGLTHSEYIVDANERCFLVETANRGGGVLTAARIVPAICGVDVSALLVANALGKPLDINPFPSNGVVTLDFFVFAPGRIKAIRGVQDVLSWPEVLHIRLGCKEGDELVAPISGAGRHGFAILKASDHAALAVLRKRLHEAVQLEYA